MKRLFLSAPMTCALLLGAGLLLRAQAALRSEPSRFAQVRVLKEEPGMPVDDSPAASHVGRTRHAPARSGSSDELREQRSSHRGKVKRTRGRKAKARKRAPARVVEGRR